MHPPETAAESGQIESTAVPPTSFAKSERLRGLKEGGVRILELRAKWPDAFPSEPQRVRPLASGAVQPIMESMGWSLPYTKGVLTVWKGRGVYCRAVLRYEQRVRLDGSVSEERVDDTARSQAQAQLDQIATRTERLRQASTKRQRKAYA